MSFRCALLSTASGEGVWVVWSPYFVGLSSGNTDGVGNSVLGVVIGPGVDDLLSLLTLTLPVLPTIGVGVNVPKRVAVTTLLVSEIDLVSLSSSSSSSTTSPIGHDSDELSGASEDR